MRSVPSPLRSYSRKVIGMHDQKWAAGLTARPYYRSDCSRRVRLFSQHSQQVFYRDFVVITLKEAMAGSISDELVQISRRHLF